MAGIPSLAVNEFIFCLPLCSCGQKHEDCAPLGRLSSAPLPVGYEDYTGFSSRLQTANVLECRRDRMHTTDNQQKRKPWSGRRSGYLLRYSSKWGQITVTSTSNTSMHTEIYRHYRMFYCRHGELGTGGINDRQCPCTFMAHLTRRTCCRTRGKDVSPNYASTGWP